MILGWNSIYHQHNSKWPGLTSHFKNLQAGVFQIFIPRLTWPKETISSLWLLLFRMFVVQTLTNFDFFAKLLLPVFWKQTAEIPNWGSEDLSKIVISVEKLSKNHNITLTILNLQGKSDRNTPDSRASTWPPTYVSESRTWPSSVSLFSIDSCLFGKTMFASKAFTINSASHRVPEPFLNT